MEQDNLYRRSMGLPYDEDGLMREISNGGRDTTDDRPVDEPYGLSYGGDVRILAEPSVEERLDLLLEEFAVAQQKSPDGNISPLEAGTFHDQAKHIRDEFQIELDQLSKQHHLYSQATQDWVLAELQSRVEVRGSDYDVHSEENYLETIDVLDKLTGELREDNEDPVLIKLVTTWRDETQAELFVSSLDLAATRQLGLAA